MKNKLSINDIAKALQVSKTTISFILNGKAEEKRISKDLTERVIKFIKENDFRPNQLAKSLSTGKTFTIGLMVEKISDYFFAQIAYHVEELANKSGYKIIYCSTENDTQKTKELIKLFAERHVDGFIITPPVGIEKEIKDLMQNDIPVVLFDRFFTDFNTSYVVMDNYESTYKAINYLITTKCANIAFIELESDQNQMTERKRGYVNAMNENRLTPNILRIPFSNDKKQTILQITSFLADNIQLDALFFATNYLTMHGIKAIHNRGLKIPHDISIVAFDDHDFFDIYTPSITAVAQPIQEMAQQLINILLNDISSRKRTIQQKVVPAKLILRDSTIRKI
ncbi:LacI family DNA-binding transcriptional regulator [Pedobacter helvus]|uniref:LacI family DNA-binding transcriptional regulator n=1 Tax=Pedobacter helvus TaxID=2563444 RepID=A0ABW9JPA2_9SPHI|nr:LacI family DNA-binding transcriptional regulator [Pedobacter ureilyticus]